MRVPSNTQVDLYHRLKIHSYVVTFFVSLFLFRSVSQLTLGERQCGIGINLFVKSIAVYQALAVYQDLPPLNKIWPLLLSRSPPE